jgi:multidrug efflux pump
LATATQGNAPLVVSHQDQLPAVTISFNLAPGYSLSDAVTAFRDVESQLKFPPQVRGQFIGKAAEFSASLTDEVLLLLAAVVVIYIVLGVLYESYIHPVTIISTLPPAGVGALLALYLCGMPLSVDGIVGIVLLIGIVKKNAIMMIDFAIEAQRAGLNAHDAIRRACILRFRPIMMTTAAALLGALPLALGNGIGSELRKPLGVAIVGGLLLSQLITLYTTPVIYLYFERFSDWMHARREQRAHARSGTRGVNISAPFIRRPIATSLLAMGLAAAGAICYFLLGISALPNLEFPAIFVSANQPGGTADVMASTVAAPLERHLGQIPGIDTINSTSSENSTSVFLMFDASRNVDDAARDVQAAINAAAPDLPSGLTNAPTYRKMNPNNQPVLALALTSDTEPMSKLYDYADSLLAQRIRQLPGVSDVEVAGGATPAVRVDLNLRALNAMGLSPDQLRNALVAANVTSPQGFLSDGKTTMAVTANDALHTAAEFADLVISMHNGVPVRLSDVASVHDGQQDQYQAAWFGARRAILLFVRKQAEANVIATVDSVKADIPLMQSWLPANVQLTPFFDRTPIIRSSVDEVQISLLISLGMVVLTMALFLRRLAPTLIAATAVPLSIAGAFIVMYVLGYTLDNMSLMALVIAIGFVVDDAIVVIENVIRHVDAGMSRLEATLLGAKEIGFTIVSITLSLIAVFAPVMFASGITGMFFKEFTVTLISAIVFSAIVSLTLTPALCGRFLSPHSEAKPSRFGDWLDRFHAGMLGAYRRLLDHALRWPRLTALQPLLLIVVTVFLMRFVHGGLFPQQDTGMLFGRITAGTDVSPPRMMEQTVKIADLVMKDPAVESVGSRLGGGYGGGGGGSGQLYITLKPLAQRPANRRST